jgi:hypothetical protein
MTTHEWVAGQKKKQENLLHKISIAVHIPAEFSLHAHLASKLCRRSKIEYCGAVKKRVMFFALIRLHRTPAQCSAALLRCRCCDSQS